MTRVCIVYGCSIHKKTHTKHNVFVSKDGPIPDDYCTGKKMTPLSFTPSAYCCVNEEIDT